ncbi:MAG TPA: glycosyltransferase family 4 protein [Azonexus sp.]|nr:glycosyltransferase family 4 protein [Azonexus sp.]
MARPIKTLLFSSLYPSSARPGHGIFVETRLRELLKTGEVETQVVAPVPWFPFSGAAFGEYGRFAATPKFECRNGIAVHHPRYYLLPKIGMNMAPQALADGAISTVRKLIADGFDFDLIDAHYYYPDGIAAGIIAREIGKPFVVTARGSDLNLISDYAKPRRRILETASLAHASIGVCNALMEKLSCLGAAPDKLNVFRNGVDLERFRPEPMDEARRHLGLAGRRIILSVGNLVELKGHDIAISAMTSLPADVTLVIVGKGPLEWELKSLANRLHLGDRVVFAGPIPNTDLRWWYSAADVLVLCSSREGWANVLLESMACGTPVISTPVGGTPEIVTNSLVGRLMRTRDSAAFLEAFHALVNSYPDRQAVRQYAEKYSWAETSNCQVALFRRIMATQCTAPSPETVPHA